MLRASRNIWLSGPYPNKMPVPTPPRSPLPKTELKPAPNQTFPPSRPFHLSPPCRSKSCPLVPSILLLAAFPFPHVYLPVWPTDSSGSSSTENGHPLSFASVVLSQRQVQRSTSYFLGEEETDCVLLWILSPSLLCSDRLCYCFFLTFYIRH